MTASFKVFVCSTVSDLTEEREAVLDAIRRLKLLHESMEFFGARPEQPIDTCLEEVQASDVVVVIVGHRYGSTVPKLGISYSEAEYNEAVRLNKPCLVYMRDENVPILLRHVEDDPEKRKLLERWKTTLRSRHTVAPFQGAAILAVQVTTDIATTIGKLEDAAVARRQMEIAAMPTQSAPPEAVIRISCGSASRLPDLPFTFSGEGFHFFLETSAGGPFGAISICGGASGCAPGTVLRISLGVYDLVNGKATYLAKRYVTGPGRSGPGPNANVNAWFDGSLTLPGVDEKTRLIHRQTVTFQGKFLYPGGPNDSYISVPLELDPTVSAIATYVFVPIKFNGRSHWQLTGARYDIGWNPG